MVSFLPSKQTLTKTAGVFVGGYLARNYIRERLDEAKQKMEADNLARENLKRRFQQTHDTTSYTILALLPTLSSQILLEMNVEGITKELQSRSAKKSAQPTPQESQSLASSIEVIQEGETQPQSSSSTLPASVVQSWVNSSSVISLDASSAPISASLVSLNSDQASFSGSASVASGQEASGMSESITSQVSVTSDMSTSTDSRTKAELWNEVKLLTLTRTLTTLYSITLLCLLTTLQLTLLARSKYAQSIIEEEEQERMREAIEAQLTISNMLFQGLGLGGYGSGLAGIESLLNGSPLDDDEEGTALDESISEGMENKYLTMSWWLLHVGWKDVGERVRRGVEEVFEGVSLKTKLSAMDLHRLVGDVRRRVEHEVTFEGDEKRTNFLSSLLPSTPETIQHVLVQGGFLASNETNPSYAQVAAYHLNPDQRDQPVSQHALSGTTHPSNDASTLSSSQLSHSQYFTSPAAGLSHAYLEERLHSGSNTSDSMNGVSEGGADNIPLPSSFPPQHSSVNPYPHIFNDPKFLSLMDETQSVISSPDFGRVLEVCLDRSTEVLFQGLLKNVFVESSVAPDSLNDDVRVRLAGLLPGLARWSQLALDGLPNELVDTLLAVHEVPCLSAILFGKFEERFQSQLEFGELAWSGGAEAREHENWEGGTVARGHYRSPALTATFAFILAMLSDLIDYDYDSNSSSAAVSAKIYDDLYEVIQSLTLLGSLESNMSKVKSIIQNLAEDDNANHFKIKGTKPVQKLDRVMLAMLDCADSEDSKRYVIKAVLVCARRAELQDPNRASLVENLRAVAVTWLTHFLFIFKSASRTQYGPISDITTPSFEDTPTESLGHRTWDRDSVLRRDAHSCVITGITDEDHPVNPGVVKLEVSHVLKRAVGHFSVQESDPGFRPASSTLDKLKNYTRLPLDYVERFEELMDHPSNAITMMQPIHEIFDKYRICLQKTDVLHTYTIEYFGDERIARFLSPNGWNKGPVVLAKHAGDDSDMPNPIFIGIHAAVARVLHMSGAGRFFDELFALYPPPSRRNAPLRSWDQLTAEVSVHQLFAQTARLGLSEGLNSG